MGQEARGLPRYEMGRHCRHLALQRRLRPLGNRRASGGARRGRVHASRVPTLAPIAYAETA